jgi:putative peptidoglycan lipid II flippase
VIARQLFVGSSLVAGGILLGRVMGFVRDSAVAHQFGVGANADVVVALLTLPDALLNFLALGALSAALIPEFAKANDRIQADRFFWRASIVTGIGAIVVAGIAALLAPQILGLLAPGITGPQAVTAERYLPVTLAAIPLTVLAGVSTARLQASQAFLVPALGTLIFNAVIASTVVWFLDPQAPVRTFAWAIIVAAGVRWLMQLAQLRAWRHPPKVTGPVLDRDVLRRYLQAVWALGAITLLPVIAKAIASMQGPGELARFHFAQRLVELPMALAVGTVTVAAFPAMAAAFAQGREESGIAANTVVGVLLAALPLCSVMFVFREPIAAIVFGGGTNDAATEEIAYILGIGLASVPIQGLAAIAVAIFNARLDTFAPAIINFAMLVAFVPLAWVLGNVAGSGGIMAGLVLANAAATVVLLGALNRRHRVTLWNVVRPTWLAGATLLCVVAVAAIDQLHAARGLFDPLSAGLLVIGMVPVALLVLKSPARGAA